MRTIVCIGILSVMLAGCNNSEQEQQLKTLAARDSALMVQAQQKDSTISAYVRSINAIQDNLDSIRSKEKVLRMDGAEGNSATGNTIAEIKSLDKLIVKNHREIYSLEKKLKKANKKDADLEKLVEHLTKELAEKDEHLF